MNIASTPAFERHIACILYSTSQVGVFAIIARIALKYVSKNIRAHSLVLGTTSNEATFSSIIVTEIRKAAMANPMKRRGKSKEVATIAANLAREEFSFSTGNTIVSHGGMMML